MPLQAQPELAPPTERRFALERRTKPDPARGPGLAMNDDGSIDVIAPNGDRAALGSGGGGGAFDGGTITQPLVVRSDVDAMQDGVLAPFKVQNVDGSHTYLDVANPNESAAVVIRADPDDMGGGDGLAVFGATGAAVLQTSIGNGDFTLTDRFQIRSDGGDNAVPALAADLISTNRLERLALAPDDLPDPFPGGVFRVLYGGAIVTAQHFEPSDAQLGDGQAAIWFDRTAGAAQLMLKAKDEAGNVLAQPVGTGGAGPPGDPGDPGPPGPTGSVANAQTVVRAGLGQFIAGGAETPVEFTTEARDDDGMTDLVARPERFTFQHAGLHLLVGSIYATGGGPGLIHARFDFTGPLNPVPIGPVPQADGEEGPNGAHWQVVALVSPPAAGTYGELVVSRGDGNNISVVAAELVVARLTA